ncbi:hypothetical protein HII31_01836 [Pseudocercospora fuligena]|uniref:Uncharacterized protein n=1 Tax=Pseudocercospora fuligena TaxID=685502 RepID=A0A8H6VLL7_9PEZI|nr:hypothetical protein HII31_01836 [Pseudocercospora fuligena]
MRRFRTARRAVRTRVQHGDFRVLAKFELRDARESEDDLKRTTKVWKSVLIPKTDMAITIEEFFVPFKVLITERAIADTELDLLGPQASEDLCVLFKLCVDSPTKEGRVFELSKQQPYMNRITELQDIFVNPESIVGTTLSVTAVLDVLLSTDIASSLDGSNRTADQIVRPALPEWDFRDLNWIRIGSTRPPTGKSNDVPTEYALVAEIDPKNSSVRKLLEIACWSLGHLCIIASQKEVQHDPDDIFDPPFDNATDLQEIETIIFHPDFDRSARRTPTIPDMTFNIFNPNVQDPPFGATLEENEWVTLVINFKSHLSEEHGKVKFDSNLQVEVDNNDTAKRLKKHVTKQLENGKGTSRLFQGKLNDAWKMELWIIPQGQRLLYRFKSGTVTQFLRQEMVDAGQKIAYMECHLWEKNVDTRGL